MTAPTAERVLAPDTSMGAVTLLVGDLEAMSSYYSRAFAMEPMDEITGTREVHRVLGRGHMPLVKLVRSPNLPKVDPRQAGLFTQRSCSTHPASLAATVYRSVQEPGSRFVGSSDHLVSEAFYFTDPEGNGVELYVDRDRSLWIHDGDEIRMTTSYLDPNAYLQGHLTQQAVEAGPLLAGTVGHVHLQVGDLATARGFHVDAPLSRLRNRSIPFDSDGRSVSVTDPCGTRITLALQGLTTDELMAQ